MLRMENKQLDLCESLRTLQRRKGELRRQCRAVVGQQMLVIKEQG